MEKNQKICSQVIAGLVIVIFFACNQTSNKDSDSLEPASTIKISFRYAFKTKEAKQLSIKAFDLRKVGQFDEAIDFYQKAIIIEHDNPKLFFDMADCYARTNRLNDAIHALDTAITLDSLYAPLYNNRGFYNYKLYNDQDAINDYKKAIELDSMRDVYHINLSLVYYTNKNYSEACDEFRIAVHLGSNLNVYKNQPEFEKLNELCK